MPPLPVSTLLILLPGSDTQLLGTSVRARNVRVAARHGVELAALGDLDWQDNHQVLLVPSSVAIDRGLFPLHASPHATWIESPRSPSTAVLLGPARELRDAARDLRCASELPRRTAPEGALLDVSTADARRRSGWSLLRGTSKPTDGWIARHFNRPISQAISYVALGCGVSANAATWLALLVGLAAALFSAQPGWSGFAIAGVLFQLASVLDGVDGEIARTTLTESDRGARFDAIVDRLTAFICFAGVMVGWMREGAGATAVLWTSILGLALGLSLWRAFRFVGRYSPGSPLLVIDGAIRRAAAHSGAAMLWLVSRAFALLRRDLFAVVFLIVGLTGIRALIPALVAFGIALANMAFWVYGQEIAAALGERRAND